MEQKEYARRVAWLNRYRSSLRHTHTIKLDLEQLRTQAEHITPVLSDAPGGGSGRGNIPPLVERMDEVRQQMAAEIAHGLELQDEINACINRLADAHQREILHLRYITGLKWEDVFSQTNMERSWVFKLHRRAVENLDIPVENQTSD